MTFDDSPSISEMPHAVSDSPSKGWSLALSNALKRHVRAEQLPLRELPAKFPATARDIADSVILIHDVESDSFINPLIPNYIEALILCGSTGISDVLLSLLRHSAFIKHSPGEHEDALASVFPSLEEQIFSLLRVLVVNARLQTAQWRSKATVFALTRWLNEARKVNEREVGKQLSAGLMAAGASTHTGIFESLGLLAISIFGQPTFRDIEKQHWWTSRKQAIAVEMQSYDANVLQWLQSQYTGRLQNLTKNRPFRVLDDKGMPIFTDEELLITILALPMSNTRAGLFIWLNACLCARPLTDDASIRNHVLLRYSENVPEAAAGLIVASFDVLTNAILKDTSTRVIRSFICNKLPLVLQGLFSFAEPNASENCVQGVLSSVNMEPRTPLSTGAAEARDMLRKSRADFLRACVMHSLVSDAAATTMSPESPASTSKATRYTKEGLIIQCAHNTARLEAVILELDGMHGNAGAIAGCLVGTVNNLCVAKDTMTLKSVCNVLLRKIELVDILLQYTRPADLLVPLYRSLNDWVHDEDQSEFQPPYEEFACILLLILAVHHRYDLTPDEASDAVTGSFVDRILYGKWQSFTTAELSEQQIAQLSKWIEGLYATDEHGDTTGIGDEVMSHCPPQAFYLLVPTLFEQSVMACKSGQMAVETARGGLEFLLEPFLLPSLVSGLLWLVERSWEDHADGDILLQILDKLLRPSSSSQDMRVMHKAILVIIATPLVKSLKTLTLQRPDKCKEAESLIAILTPHLHRQKALTSSVPDEASAKSVIDQLRRALKELVQWATGGGQGTLPVYDPTVVHAATSSSDNEAVLDLIVDELAVQTSLHRGPITLDICTAIACAPTPSSYIPLLELSNPLVHTTRKTLDLRDLLRLRAANVQALQEMPSAEASALIQLSRAVAAQSTISPSALVSLSVPTAEQAVTDQVMKDLGLTTEGATLDDSLFDPVATFDNDTDFANVTFDVATDAALNLTDSQTQDINNLMAADTSGMQIDPSATMFSADNMVFDATQPVLASNDALMGGAGNVENAEEDIFAGLDFEQETMDFNFD
ncbi:hypothetical protein LTR95_011978 [Oleoguttula sp. CCFEE 5521]